MQECSMPSVHELSEPKSASTSQIVCGGAEMVRLRLMSVTRGYAFTSTVSRS
jgi:hypothetical protein